MSNIYSTLCRFCLQDQGIIPIFKDEEKNVSSKVLFCLHEKIEDINGYPRSICNDCNCALDLINKFVTRYKESSKILETHFLSNIKYEPQEINSDCTGFSEPEVELNNLKIEYDNDCDDLTLNYLSNVKKNKCNENNKITKKTNKTKKKRKYKSKNTNVKTNFVATSILEGVFNWTGEKWCHSTRLKVEPLPDKLKGRQPKLDVNKIKKEKKIKEPRPRPSKLCDLCGEVFKNADKLSKHHTKMHTDRPKISCTYKGCKGIFTNIHNMKRHLRRLHVAVKKYQCNDCGRFFAIKAEMIRHMRIHDRVKYPQKLFKCKLCDKTYKCQKSVDIHERSAHTGLRPAVCSVCGAAFFHEDYLKQHMYLHTGETPFHCPVCGRGYAQRGNMKSHLRIHRVSEVSDEILKKMKASYLKLLKY